MVFSTPLILPLGVTLNICVALPCSLVVAVIVKPFAIRA